MATLTRASKQLFERSEDERFGSFQELREHCAHVKSTSTDVWQPPQTVEVVPDEGTLALQVEDGQRHRLVDWSFSQLCRLAKVSKDTINRLAPQTAAQALQETLPTASKPIQLLAANNRIRSLHGVNYTRLWNSDLLDLVGEYASDFQPPQVGMNGATGLYAGEQDMFVFMIDPNGWTEIDGEAFAPGFFCWNSEVGRRSLGIQTFWFQRVCQNHIIWDATEVIEFSRKHTANVQLGLIWIRQIIERLIKRRDERRDDFFKLISKAMRERLGNDADAILKQLTTSGLPRGLAKQATELAQQEGAFTIFSVVDALTRLSQEVSYAGERNELDAQAASLLALAA